MSKIMPRVFILEGREGRERREGEGGKVAGRGERLTSLPCCPVRHLSVLSVLPVLPVLPDLFSQLDSFYAAALRPRIVHPERDNIARLLGLEGVPQVSFGLHRLSLDRQDDVG